MLAVAGADDMSQWFSMVRVFRFLHQILLTSLDSETSGTCQGYTEEDLDDDDDDDDDAEWCSAPFITILLPFSDHFLTVLLPFCCCFSACRPFAPGFFINFGIFYVLNRATLNACGF
jgi:uncharacterized protein YceK